MTETLDNSVKLLGEVFVPGASELLKGNIGSGLVHNLVAGVGMLALAGAGFPLLGGLLVLGTKANSFSRSVGDKNVWQVVGESFGKKGSQGGGPAHP
jgi:hypothetical protein